MTAVDPRILRGYARKSSNRSATGGSDYRSTTTAQDHEDFRNQLRRIEDRRKYGGSLDVSVNEARRRAEISRDIDRALRYRNPLPRVASTQLEKRLEKAAAKAAARAAMRAGMRRVLRYSDIIELAVSIIREQIMDADFPGWDAINATWVTTAALGDPAPPIGSCTTAFYGGIGTYTPPNFIVLGDWQGGCPAFQGRYWGTFPGGDPTGEPNSRVRGNGNPVEAFPLGHPLLTPWQKRLPPSGRNRRLPAYRPPKKGRIRRLLDTLKAGPPITTVRGTGWRRGAEVKMDYSIARHLNRLFDLWEIAEILIEIIEIMRAPDWLEVRPGSYRRNDTRDKLDQVRAVLQREGIENAIIGQIKRRGGKSSYDRRHYMVK